MNRRKFCHAVLGSSLLSCAFALAFLSSRDADESGNRHGADLPGDIGEVSIDPEWARQLAERPRDPTGLSGSGVISQVHGGDPHSASKSGTYASRLFRTGYAGVEPTLGVTSNGWIFYIAIVTTKAVGLDSVVIRSKDGGASWERVGAPRPTADPYLWVDPATDRVFSVDFDGCGLMSYSDNYGETWADLPPVGCGHNTDHQTMYAGPPVTSSTSGYPNVIYYCSIGGGALNTASTETVCSKSLDGAQTFVPTLTPPFPVTPAEDALYGFLAPCNGASGHVFVGADGTVYVPRGVCGQPWLAISRDEGATWSRGQVAGNGMGRDIFGLWDHEAAVRADKDGNIFYSWVARDRIPYVAVSRDGGETWGAPIRVAPPELKEANLPNMDLDEKGRLVFVYMGSTNSPGSPFPNDSACSFGDKPEEAVSCPGFEAAAAEVYAEVTWNGYISLTRNPLHANPVFETAPANDPADPLIRGQCGPFRCQAEYDFIDVEFGPDGEIVAAVIDGCEPEQPCTDPGEAVLGTLVEAAAAPSLLEFVADGTLPLAFTPDPARTIGVASPEGCEPGVPVGALAPPPPAGACHSGLFGFVVGVAVPAPADFTSAPLANPIVLGGETRIVVYIADPLRPADALNGGRFEYVFEEIASDGGTYQLGFGLAVEGVVDGRNQGIVELTPRTVLAGSRLRIRLTYPGYYSSGARMLFGGESYGDAGITLTVGHFETKKADAAAKDVAAPEGRGLLLGALSPAVLLVFAGLLVWRRSTRQSTRSR